MRRLLPSPVLSAGVALLWLLLNQSLDAATLLLAAILGVLMPLLTAGLRPTPVRIRHPLVVLRLMLHVTADMLRSNLAVARGILTKRSENISSGFIHVPLELRDPNGLAVLAMIVCATPGTAWAEVALDRSMLLIHVFELEDPEEAVAFIKRRYEQPLREIFE